MTSSVVDAVLYAKNIITDIANASPATKITTVIVLNKMPSQNSIKSEITLPKSSSQLKLFENFDHEFVANVESESDIAMIVSLLRPAASFNLALKDGDSDSNLWGLFEKDTATEHINRFSMKAWSVQSSGNEIDFEERNQLTDIPLTFSFSASDLGMRVFDQTNPVISSPVQQEIDEIIEHFKIAFTNQKLVDVFSLYVKSLFIATRKYILTENDADVFYGDLKRSKFMKTEKALRKQLWDLNKTNLLVTINSLEARLKRFENLDSSIDHTSLKMTLEVLIGFLQAIPVDNN